MQASGSSKRSRGHRGDGSAIRFSRSGTNICTKTAHNSQADVPCRVLLTRSDKGLMLVEAVDLDRCRLLSLTVSHYVAACASLRVPFILGIHIFRAVDLFNVGSLRCAPTRTLGKT